MEKKTHRLTFDIPIELVRKLKISSALNDISMRKIIIKLLEDYLKIDDK